MVASADIALMAHLMRRAGFGARRDELEQYAAQGYSVTVEWLLNPQAYDGIDEDIVDRYYIDIDDRRGSDPTNAWWLYPDDQHQEPSSGEDGPLLARSLRDRLRESGKRTSGGRANRDVPGTLSGEFPHHSAQIVP